MKNMPKRTSSTQESILFGKQYNYTEVVEFLDSHWSVHSPDKSMACIKKLNQAFESPAESLNTIFITGTNGKSLTINFAAQLLKEEGLKVGCLYNPHILTYNERIAYNQETITNKLFTDLANEVIQASQTLSIKVGTQEILAMMALLHFKRTDMDVVLVEIDTLATKHPLYICNPKITAITRIVPEKADRDSRSINTLADAALTVVKKDTHVISADQSKLHLQTLQEATTKKGAHWAMPIRKLAPLQYPFEQLHGRCAALAERIADIYVNQCLDAQEVVIANSLLSKQTGQRGRPTLEAKRQSEMNPRRTMAQFWKDALSTLHGRFQIFEKEKPTLLLDNAHNLDAFKNVLLGIRLLHYQRPLKGLTLILSTDNPELDQAELLKLLRYFFKKTSGSIIVCPSIATPGRPPVKSWDVEKITNDIKSMKIKARPSSSFKEAFEMAEQSVDERYGLVAIAGSNALLSEYWRYKGLKKL